MRASYAEAQASSWGLSLSSGGGEAKRPLYAAERRLRSGGSFERRAAGSEPISSIETGSTISSHSGHGRLRGVGQSSVHSMPQQRYVMRSQTRTTAMRPPFAMRLRANSSRQGRSRRQLVYDGQ